jgi:UPF0755 protein
MKKLIVLILIALVLLGAGWLVFSRSFDQQLTITEPVFFVIPQGSTLTSVANDLEEKQIIKSADTLLWLNRLEKAGPVLAASYEFPPEYTIRDLYDAIITGDSISDEVQVTFREGLVITEMADLLVEARLISDPQEFILATSNGIDRFVSQFSFLESIPEGQDLEGYLFPDTYRFFADATVDEIILAMLRNFDAKFTDEMRASIANSDKSIHELVTFASIVEKEVRSIDDMKVVAGLFQNRLDIGMLLQADSTIGYITRSGRDRSTFADLEIDSPYNSYKYAGLPPGPISNPGINAIIAAINPAETDYLFFLTNRTSGQVYYGRNLAEHNRNRELYLE